MCPISCHPHDIGYTEDQLSKLFLVPRPANILRPDPAHLGERRRRERETKKGWEPFHCGKSQRPRLTLWTAKGGGEGIAALLSALNYLQRHFLLNVRKKTGGGRGQTFLPLSLSLSLSLSPSLSPRTDGQPKNAHTLGITNSRAEWRDKQEGNNLIDLRQHWFLKLRVNQLGPPI